MRQAYFLVSLVGLGMLAIMWLSRPYFLNILSDIILTREIWLSIHRLLLIVITVFTIEHLVGFIYIYRYKLNIKDNFLIGIRHLAFVAYAILALLIFLSVFNISITEAFTSVSIFAAALAIVLKDYVSNMINGMIITFQAQISIGDVVRIGEQRGKVMRITLMYIHLLNDDDDLVYIPNNVCFQQEVVNYTKREIKKSSIDFEIAYERMETLEELERYLITQMGTYHDEVRDDSYNLRVTEMAMDKLRLKFQYILKNAPNKELEKEIRKYVIRSIVRYTNRYSGNNQ